MKNSLVVSTQAQNDLHEILDYTYLETLDKTAREKMSKDICDTMLMLVDNPLMRKELFYRNSIPSNYRYLVYKKYMIFYFVENNIIHITRIIHSRRDYIQILFNE